MRLHSSSALRLLGVALLAGLLAACGDSGSTAATTTTTTTTTSLTTTTVVVANSLGITVDNDTSTAALAGNGNGQWDGSGGGGGSDGGGGAGDGEFVQFSFQPKLAVPFATLTWKVLKSEYGIQGQTGSMALTVDNNKGGYSAGTTTVAGSTITLDLNKQANIYIGKAGQLNGSLPFKIGSNTVYMVFNGSRYKDVIGNLAQVAGTYFYGLTARQAATATNPQTDYGTLQINTDGTGRICSKSAYSNTCSNGYPIDIVADDPATPRVLKFSTPAPRSLLGYALIRDSGGQLTGTMDLSTNDQTNNRVTGAMYFAKMQGSYASTTTVGSWSVVSTDPVSASRSAVVGYVRHTSTGASSTNYAKHEAYGTDCSNTTWTDTGVTQNASTYPGMAISDRTNVVGTSSFVIPMGQDIFVRTQPTGSGQGSLSINRKYTVTGGDPNPC